MKDLTDEELRIRSMPPPLIDLDAAGPCDWRAMLLGLVDVVDQPDIVHALAFALERPTHPGATLQDPSRAFAAVEIELPPGEMVPYWRLHYAAAVAGWREAQVAVAVAFAGLAVEQRDLSDEYRDRLGGDAHVCQRLDLRAETCAGVSIGWGAVAEGRRSRRLPSAPFDEHARQIGAEIVASLWHGGPAERASVPPSPEEAEREMVRVVPQIAGSASYGKEVAVALRDVADRMLPLARTPSAERLARVRADIIEMWPHAAAVVDRLFADLVPGRPMRLRPTLVVGPPGTGKSRLVRAVLDHVGIPFASLDAASCADHALTGSPRRWSHSYPSLPVGLVVERQMANPALLIDELEKAGRSSAGSIHDALLGLLEPETSKRWRDQYLDAECDLSRLSWVFTANATAGIPAPLLSRLRVLRVPAPGPEHLAALAPIALADVLEERGSDPVFEAALDGMEMDAIRRTFAASKNASLRDLRRIVEAVLDARAQSPKN
jgi:hypothetical protein